MPDLPGQLCGCRRWACGGLDATSRDDAIESSRDEELARCHDDHNILVGSRGADAIVRSQAMGEPLAEIAELGFIDTIGRVVSIAM